MYSCYAAALRNNRGLCKPGDILQKNDNEKEGSRAKGEGGGRNDQLMKLQGDERIDPGASRSLNL